MYRTCVLNRVLCVLPAKPVSEMVSDEMYKTSDLFKSIVSSDDDSLETYLMLICLSCCDHSKKKEINGYQNVWKV